MFSAFSMEAVANFPDSLQCGAPHLGVNSVHQVNLVTVSSSSSTNDGFIMNISAQFEMHR